MEASLLVAAIAGAAGGGLLLGGRLLAFRLDPRPCWEKNDCALRRSDPEACFACPVFVFKDVPASDFMTKELRLPALRNFEPETAEVAA
jgi:hypothetical protein